MSLHSFTPLILNLVLFTFQNSLASVNPKFQACEPKTCGNGPNISYPFYIHGEQDPSCGFPRFGLTCAPDGFPLLNLTNSYFIVQEIFYTNTSLRVSDPNFWSSNANECLSRSRNLTLYGNRYDFAPNQKTMWLFFDCETPSRGEEEYRIGCDGGNRTRSVLAMNDGNEKMGYASKSCRGGSVRTMVGEEGYESGREGIKEALRRGFVLIWEVSECEDCEQGGGRCGFDMDAYSFRCHCPDGDDLFKCQSEDEKLGVIRTVIAAIASAVVVVGALIIVIYCFRRKLLSHKITCKAHQDFEAFFKSHGPLAIKRYTYSEIKKMTNSFKEKLGQGGYGSVFKGMLHDKSLVAVKVLNETKGNGEEFINEVASISRTSHVNIVTLLGFCFKGSKKALVYEFMANGSLEKFIYEDKNNPLEVDHQLSCEILYRIAVGVARGLEYLHRGCNTRILHFDIKPHNILLDENFFPKISDFGLAKICPRDESIVSMFGVRGTIGYIAPEVISRNFGEVSHKSDVYSFGMMVLEMVGGRRNVNVEVDRTSELYFPHWVYKRVELNQELALKNMRNEGDKERMRQMVITSLWCIQTNPSDRPMMSKVVEMLEGSVEALQVPPKPYLSSPSTSPCVSSSTHC